MKALSVAVMIVGIGVTVSAIYLPGLVASAVIGGFAIMFAGAWLYSKVATPFR